MQWNHKFIEKNIGVMALLVVLTVSVGGLVEIVPLYFQKSTTEPVAGLKPYTALQLAGRDIYLREGCYNCHSQMIRPFRAETERYGPYSVAGEFVYDHPFQWGSKRTGPDLHRVGGRYSDDWHLIHFLNPRDVVPESNMPAYPWLARNKLEPAELPPKMRALRRVGVPYTDAQIAASETDVMGKTEMDALIAYMQVLGTSLKAPAVAAAVTPATPAGNPGGLSGTIRTIRTIRTINTSGTGGSSGSPIRTTGCASPAQITRTRQRSLMDINTLRIVFTLAGFVIFIGIIAWAVSPSNRRRFEEAAQIPLDEGAPPGSSGSA